jgi:enhancing lycopene biosynthesis protein 2
MNKKIAVVLCGSGYKDGSEIRESVATLWALSTLGTQAQCFAPNDFQTDVVNCLTGETVPSEKRNQLVEAARIARGQIKALSELHAKDFDGIILPGGFGAAKNLCSFAFKGSEGAVRADLNIVLQNFYTAQKPIGAICIAPALVALAFRGKGFELTLGEEGEASSEIEKLGHRHIVKRANECHVDSNHKIVTTPAYMYDNAPLHEIFTGIQKLVQEVVSLTRSH